LWGRQGDDDADWDRVIDVNVRAYVRAAKALCARLARPRPRILRRCRLGRRTAHQIDATDYSVTKHAAVDSPSGCQSLTVTRASAFLRVAHGGAHAAADRYRGVIGSVARMAAAAVSTAGELTGPDRVAELTVRSVRDGAFLVPPHPIVGDIYRQKRADYER
jgi:NAD(P)-dependent dehydrogenase (short-subunit alcohol dehydrogenase family)